MRCEDKRPDEGLTGPTTAYDPEVDLSAIVVNWNGREHLELCLASLFDQTGGAVEVILVDNGSSDGSVDFVRERFSGNLRILENDTNLGYGQGLNLGMRVARGRYLMALNNDIEVAPGCLAALVDAADRHPNSGSFAPKILNFSDRSVIDNVGHLLYPDGLSRGRGRLEVDRGQYDEEEDILIASGCAMLLRRAMLADVGCFDSDLFAYCEDTDLGLRAQLAGWHCRSVPSAVVFHKYSAASAAYSPLKAFLVERNRFWVALKCLPGPLLAFSPALTLLRLAAQAWGVLTRRGAAGRFAAEHSAASLAGILLRALAAAFRGAPVMWRKRRGIQSRRRVSTAEVLARFARHRMGLGEIAWKD